MPRRKSFFNIRKPSLKGRIAARTSLKRMFRAKVNRTVLRHVRFRT
jgi:hypothetical protein